MRRFNLADLFEIVADAVPDRLALVAGSERLTYRALDERATRLAHVLLDRGVKAGEHIAIFSRNRAEWIETMLAAFKISAVPININYRYVEAELGYLLEDSDSVMVVVEEELKNAVLAESRLLIMGSEYEAELASASGERDFGERSNDDRYVLYTGGTTGMPKGVIWRHEDLFFAALGGGGFGFPDITEPEQLAERIAPLDARMVPVVCAPMMHGGGQWMALITFFGGGTMVLFTGAKFDPDEIWRLVEYERANQVMVVGDAMARPLAEALERGGYDTSSVVIIGTGGAILSDAVREQLGKHLPNAIVLDSFGASETGAGGAIYSQGSFTMGEEMTVLGDDLGVVAPGDVGRLARRGHIPLGYYKDEEKTKATFVTDHDGVRWVVPGDLARLEPSGTITLLGRGSGCINTGGEKVFPEEVEAALKSHADVFDTVVVGVSDERFVERVAAVVQPRPGATPTLDALQQHCRATLAGYKVPRALVIVDTLERTPAGKPDYRWARRVAATPRKEVPQ